MTYSLLYLVKQKFIQLKTKNMIYFKIYFTLILATFIVTVASWFSDNIMITYIANTLFILHLLFWIWMIVCSIIYRDKPSNDLTGQSERQKKNDDYNTNYHPGV
jgi:uncharacterized membrane protein